MKDIPDGSVDMILCDLPYGTTACKWDVVIPFEPLWKQYERIIKPNGAIVLFALNPFSGLLVASKPHLFKTEWIWKKTKATNYTQAKRHPLKHHEHILVFGKGTLTYNPQFVPGKPYRRVHRKPNKPDAVYLDTRSSGHVKVNDGWRYPSSIQEFVKPEGKACVHPTQKPVALLEYLIKTYTNPGELVLDNCMGSGSTGVACVNTNRRFIGIEKDRKYFDIAKKRHREALKK